LLGACSPENQQAPSKLLPLFDRPAFLDSAGIAKSIVE